ncbi:MAG: Ig-like domain-containing protein [Clostridia bacterium]|nr:Ig-like domain-containing protein [Clostridia bacterium]
MSTAKKLLVRAAAESQVGNARGINEDNVYFNGDYITPHTARQDFAIKTGEYAHINCFAVLDGMGRNNTGSYASLLAASGLDTVSDRLAFDMGKDVDTVVLDYIRTTNVATREQIRETGGVRTASTLALLIIENENAHVYNAGDSRVYLFRDKQLIKLTRDHVSARGQHSVALTEEGIRNGGLTKYLGMAEADGNLEPYRAKAFKIKKGDKFLVCSDGLTDYVDEEDIASCLLKRKDPFGHTNELMSMAYNEDSADNISVIVAEVVEPGLHVTQNMILTALACLILTAGLIVGGLMGFIIGAGSVDRNTGFVDYSNSIQGTTTTTTSTLPPVSPGDISGSDVSGSDAGQSSGLGSSTQYPTTTYPTTTTAPYNINSFKLDASDITMNVGQTYRFGVEIYSATNEEVPREAIIWSSSDPSIATVDDDGTVTGIAPGRVTIYATIKGLTEDLDQTEDCKFTIKRKK